MRRKRDIATIVDRKEMKVLEEGGMLRIADDRTRAIVRQHVAGDSRVSTIAIDCYLQGVRDAAQTMYESVGVPRKPTQI